METTDRKGSNRSGTKATRKAAETTGTDKRSKSERAYDEIKRKILSAEYSPGQFLQESMICEALGIGRTPVHQAVHLLMLEGLLEVIPRKGIVVRTDSINDTFTVLEVRMLIEPYCASLAAERASANEIARLRASVDRAREALSSDDQADYMKFDLELHTLITDTAGNSIIRELVHSLHERMSRIWFLPHWRSRDLELTQSEHEAVVVAIEKRDKDAAADAMRTHIQSLRRRILSTLDKPA